MTFVFNAVVLSQLMGKCLNTSGIAVDLHIHFHSSFWTTLQSERFCLYLCVAMVTRRVAPGEESCDILGYVWVGCG